MKIKRDLNFIKYIVLNFKKILFNILKRKVSRKKIDRHQNFYQPLTRVWKVFCHKKKSLYYIFFLIKYVKRKRTYTSISTTSIYIPDNVHITLFSTKLAGESVRSLSFVVEVCAISATSDIACQNTEQGLSMIFFYKYLGERPFFFFKGFRSI